MEGAPLGPEEHATVLSYGARLGALTSLWLLSSVHPCAAQRLSIDPEAALTLEGTTAEGLPVFGWVVGATRLGDGTIVVADRSANALRFFDGEGLLTATVGREGEGPGEFQVLGGVTQCRPDSLFAFDALPRSISVFSASGRFIRKFELAGMPSMVTCSRNGTLAMLRRPTTEWPRDPATRVRREMGSLTLADARGSTTAELGEVSMIEFARVGRGWYPPPGSGHASIAVAQRRVIVCPMDSGSMSAFSLAGARLHSIPLRVPRRAPTRLQLERSADASVRSMPAGAVRDAWRRQLLRLPPPNHLPPCSKLLADADDNVWVVLSFPGDSVTTLRVFGPDDQVLGDVSIPAALNVHEIGADYLLASGETPEGEPWVRMYRVRRSRTR